MLSIARSLFAATSALTVIATAASATPIATSGVLATGGALGTQPDSVTTGAGSVWVEYGNGTDSTGAGGSSTVVRYDTAGNIQATLSIAGSVDGLRYNARDNTVWALQNQDGNSHLTIIDAATNKTTAVSYAATSPTMGYDDVAFKGKTTFLSYTNPAAPTDPVILKIVPGTSPIAVKPILLDGAPGAKQTVVDPDSLVLTKTGELIQSSGDDGTLTFVHAAGTAAQSVRYLALTDASGAAVKGLDDTLFVPSKSGTLYLTETSSNTVLDLHLSGLTPGTLLANVGSLGTLGFVDLTTGVVTPFVTGLSGPHGLAFVPDVSVPEPASLAVLGMGAAGLLAARRRRG